MNTRVFGAQRFSNLIVYSVGGHNDQIVGAYFEQNSLDVSFYHINYEYQQTQYHWSIELPSSPSNFKILILRL